MSRFARQLRTYRTGIAGVLGAAGLAAAIAALGPRGDFLLTFVYVACTLAVCACTTLATIRVLVWLWRGKSGDPEGSGMVEIGLLIGLFVISPLTLTGAFELLQAIVGPL